MSKYQRTTDFEVIRFVLKKGLEALREEIYNSEPFDQKEQYANIDKAAAWLETVVRIPEDEIVRLWEVTFTTTNWQWSAVAIEDTSGLRIGQQIRHMAQWTWNLESHSAEDAIALGKSLAVELVMKGKP